MEESQHLLTGKMDTAFVQGRMQEYATRIHDKSSGLTNCVGLIDGTVLGIARPTGYDSQMVAYNGHKRKHRLKYQAVNSPDGLILHAFGPVEGRRHDWTFYVRSCIDEELGNLMQMGGRQYCLYGDSGYSRRWFLEVPYQGSALSTQQ